MIQRNPCGPKAIKLPSAPRLRRPKPTPEQVAVIAEGIGLDYAPMVYTSVVLGLR